MQAKGVRGVLRWGYYDAATLGAWTLTKIADGPGWSLTATVQTSNLTRISQRPLMFEAPHPHGAWRWPIDTLQITDASLTATLGPQER